MKIHHISICNIASLKGFHHIDLDAIHQNSGLFAITGKTGAGKSTILNSISLALYGTNYKTSINAIDFITLGEAEGHISVKFSSANRMYLTNWKVRVRKKNGEILKKSQQSRELFEFIEGKMVALDKLANDILELSFDEFCKTTILNQGEFAKFLTSSFTERKSILEKFYQEDSLILLAPMLRRLIKIEEDKISLHRSSIKGISDTLQGIKITQDDIIFLKKKKKITGQAKERANLISKGVSDLLDLYSRRSDNIVRLEGNKAKIKENTESLNLISQKVLLCEKEFENLNSQYLAARPLLQECVTKLKLTDQNEKLIIISQTKNDAIELSASKIKETIISHQNELKIVQEKLEKLTPKIERYSDYQLVALKALLARAEHIYQNYDRANYELLGLKDQQSNIYEKRKILKEKLKISEKILTGPSESDLTDQIRANTLLKETEEKNLRVHKEVTKRKVDLEQEDYTLQKNITAKKQDFNNSTTIAAQKRLIITALDDSIRLRTLEDSIYECRLQSQKDGICIVCESNLQKDLPLATNSNTDIALVKSQLDLENTQLTKLTRENIILAESLKALSISLENNQIEHRAINKEISRYSLEELELTLLEFTNKEAKLRRKELDLSIEKQKLLDMISSLKQLDLEESILFKTIQEISTKKSKLESNLKALIIDFNDEKSHPSYKESLNKIKTIIQFFEQKEQYLQKLDSTSDKITLLTTQVDALRTQYSENSDSISVLRVEVSTNLAYIKQNSTSRNPSQDIFNFEENIKKSNNQLTEFLNQKKVFEINSSELQSKISMSNDQILEIESLSKQIMSDLQKANFQADKSLDQDFVELEKLISKINKTDFSNISADSLSGLKLGAMEILSNLTSLFMLSNDEFTKKNTLYTQKQQNQKLIDSIELDLLQNRTVLDKYLKINQLLGKDEFRNYVLALIETMLIKQTNIELKSLCQGRYHLEQTTKNQKMASEFTIVDHYLDGFSRKVSTLSGGETFLVSLAMAMALAEMTRGKVEVDSLFIDEGFGTLDHESINEVFDLLQSIENRGKQIGIISHVHELTSKIPVNINLDKNGYGHSSVEIIYN